MKNLYKLVLITTLSLGVIGCSANSAEADAEEARVTTADADARIATRASNSADTPVGRGVIPSGTLLKVALIDAVDSDTSSAGDRLSGEPVRSRCDRRSHASSERNEDSGPCCRCEGAGRVKGRASIRLALTDIVQGDRMIAITTDTFAATADSPQGRDAGVIAGGAGVGAVIGAIAGGKKGAAIGAATGGGAGTGVVLATKGKEIHYGPETRLNFTLTNSVEL